jgi:hypothetical protein
MPFIFFQVPQTELDIDTVRTILNEYRINNADVVLRDDSTADDLVDVIVVVSFIGGENRSTQRIPSTCGKSLINFII